MTRLRRAPRAPTLRRTGWVVAVLVVMSATVWAVPAAAHSVLVSSTPGAGSVVNSAPDTLVLVFNELVTLGDEPIRLFDAKGDSIDVGDATQPAGDSKRVEAPLEQSLRDGSYVLAWRVTSADSHPLNGAFTFAVGAPTTGVDTGSLVTGLLQDRGSPVVAWTLSILRWLVYASVAVAVGGWIVARWIWPEGAPLRRTRRWISVGAGIAVLSSALAVAAQGAYAAGEGVGSMFDPSLWSDVLATRFGQAAVIRMAGAGLLLMGVSLALRRRARDLVCGIATLLVVLGVILANHATTGRWVAAALAADALHVAAMCAWIGGLVGLCAWILVRRPESEAPVVSDGPEERGPDPHSDEVGLAAVHRFSALAVVSVVLLVGSGVLQSIRQVGGPNALTSTTYGRVLLTKAAVVAVLLAVAFVSRRLMGQWRKALDAEPVALAVGADVDPAAGAPGAGAMRTFLRRSIAVEVGLAVVVLGASTALSNAVPAIEAVALPFTQTVANDQGIGEIFVDPAKVGDTELHVIVTNLDGTTPDVAEMTVTMRLPERDVGPIEVAMQRFNDLPNDYWAPSASFPFPGTWEIEARARVGEFEQKVFRVEVTVR